MSQRTEQVESLIRKQLGEIFSRELELPDALATITKVTVTPDLRLSTVFISVLPFAQSKSVLKKLQTKRSHLQQQLTKVMTMKFCPKLKFVLDDIPEYVGKLEEIFHEEELH